MDALFTAPSWKISAGYQTVRHRACRFCGNGNVNGGIGAAVETQWLNREVYFAVAEADANYSRTYEERHRIGGGATVGMYGDLTDRWRVMVTGSDLRYPLGDKSDDIRWFVGQRYTLGRNRVVRLEYTRRDRDNDVLFAVQASFWENSVSDWPINSRGERQRRRSGRMRTGGIMATCVPLWRAGVQ
jgi:hypothetical protein